MILNGGGGGSEKKKWGKGGFYYQYLALNAIPIIKMGFHQKLGNVRDALATDISMYIVMGSWKLGKTRKS